MKKYCVDFEIAKKLNKNGFPQNTAFYYFKRDDEVVLKDFKSNKTKNYSAPTSDEILKELPKTIQLDYLYFLYINCYENQFVINYETNTDNKILIEIFDNKFSNALAKLWLYLKKEGYIK